MGVGAEVVEVLDVPAAYLTKVGLASPTSRFLTLSTIAAGLAYSTKMQSSAFRKDGSAKPVNVISYEPDAVPVHKHFLFYPVAGSFLFVAFFT